MYRRVEIVLIPVPFSDLSASKRRPVLVISNDKHNASGQDMIVVAIISNVVQTGIPIANSDLMSGQLPKPSIIRCDKIYTLDQSIVVKPIGFISNTIQDSVVESINRLISRAE